MTQNGQEKVLRAGFTVIRKDDNGHVAIKKLRSPGVWVLLEKFPTKASRDQKFIQMLHDPLIIED